MSVVPARAMRHLTFANLAAAAALVVALGGGGWAVAATQPHPNAAASGKVVTKIVTAAPGVTVTVATNSTLVVQLRCSPIPSGALQADLFLSTKADHASVDGTSDQAGSFKDPDLNVADGPVDADFDFSGNQDIANTSFSAMTAAGVTWTAYGLVGVYPGGAQRCVAQLTTAG